MGLDPVAKFDLQHVGLSARRPVQVRRDYYGGTGRNGIGAKTALARAYPYLPLYEPEGLDHILPHTHAFCEVALVAGGGASHVVEDGVLALKKGDVLVIPEGATHSYEQLRELELVSLFYMGAWLADDLTEVWGDTDLIHMFVAGALFNLDRRSLTYHFRLEPRSFKSCVRELEDVAREQDKDEPNRPFLRGCLLKFLVMLSQARQRALGVAGLGHMRPEVWRTLDGLERALEAGETVRVASLAAAQSLSPEHLTREFKRATGLSIMQYFQRRRMTRAARQLLHPEASATDVAYALGFSDYAHFRRRFKAHFGESPSNYRKARL